MFSITPVDGNTLFNAMIDLKKGSVEQNTRFILYRVRKPGFDLAHAKEIIFEGSST